VLRTEKQESIKDIENICKNSASLIVTHYHGLTVSQLSNLRNELKAVGGGLKIVKNTLSKIAAKNSDNSEAVRLFSGPTAIAYSNDQVAVAKALVTFAKNNNKLKIIGAIIDNKVVDSSDVNIIATLPSFDEMRAKLLATLLAPATNIAKIVQAPVTQVVRVIAAFTDKDKIN